MYYFSCRIAVSRYLMVRELSSRTRRLQQRNAEPQLQEKITTHDMREKRLKHVELMRKWN